MKTSAIYFQGFRPRWLGLLLAGLGLLCLGTMVAMALQVTQVSPEGRVKLARQVKVTFDTDAVNFGDAKAAAPVQIVCDGDAAQSVKKGAGRWITGKEWVFDFESALPAGSSCALKVKPDFRSAKGEAISGKSSFSFGTGGPAVLHTRPYGGQIEENQYFLFELNAAVKSGSFVKNVWCEVEGLGERIPIVLLAKSERKAVIKALDMEDEVEDKEDWFQAFRCERPLPAGASVRVVYGEGVSTQNGVANQEVRQFGFDVLPPFKADFTCERESAEGACIPIGRLALQFNAPVALADAKNIRLKPQSTGFLSSIKGLFSSDLKPVFDESEEENGEVESLYFPAPLPPDSALELILPKGLKDVAGRELGNADSFPLTVHTGPEPALVKFASAPFGIVERLAVAADDAGGDKNKALLPMTVRNVELALKNHVYAPGGRAQSLKVETDKDIIAWYNKVRYFDQSDIDRKRAAALLQGDIPKQLDRDDNSVQSRMVSLLKSQSGVQSVALPTDSSGADSAAPTRPFEVLGLPLSAGFHVVEVESKLLGQRLLDPLYGKNRTMYVRTSALVTNLGVHFKLGREGSVAWVTTLDKAAPVAGARVAVSDCRGKLVASGKSDKNGFVMFKDLSPRAPRCRTPFMGADGQSDASSDDDEGYGDTAYFVSARAKGVGDVEDLAFTWTDWEKGIESWRFNHSTSLDARRDIVAHTVLDRNLLRAGQTVSMKHFIRAQTATGFTNPEQLPTTMVVTHIGSDEPMKSGLQWRKSASGGLSAVSSLTLAATAKLGTYQVALVGGLGEYATSQFRVEEFRLPVYKGSIEASQKEALVAVKKLPVQVQLAYISGGPVANLPVQVSAMLKESEPNYPEYGEFSFSPPKAEEADADAADGAQANQSDEGEGAGEGEPAYDNAQGGSGGKLIANKLPAKLDKNGLANITLEDIQPSNRVRKLHLEANYLDASGEVQTLSHSHTLWPSAVVLGVKSEGWVSANKKSKLQVLALDTKGKPLPNVAVEVRAKIHTTTSSRKRMVGGFYSYDNQQEVRDLGQLCEGKSDSRGLLLCDADIAETGELEIVASAEDQDGNAVAAATWLTVTQQGELWFGGEDHDRIDVLADKKVYQAGEMAKFQVRMPFRFATAWVTVEREGVLHSEVVQLNGDDPYFTLKVDEAWGPNVYIGAFVVRGRLREVPWYSFFTWGYRAPSEWWNAFRLEGKDYIAPTAMVDLSKPAFRYGVAAIRVDSKASQLQVQVQTDKPTYQIREQARVTINVSDAKGQAAAGAEVAVAVVDKALLELWPNPSWNLFEAMMQERAWGVSTSTAQMEIIGRRHYGKKAAPPGGGGGSDPTRELFDTLLLWNPSITLDAKGQAQLTVPMNDSLSAFEIVVIADKGVSLFGTGRKEIRTTQNLQIINGLPPLVRSGDVYEASVTLRNTTAKAMKVQLSAQATGIKLPTQTVDIAAESAKTVAWNIDMAKIGAALKWVHNIHNAEQKIEWQVQALDTVSGSKDAIKLSQVVSPEHLMKVQQAMLVQANPDWAMQATAPAGALANMSGIRIGAQATLAGGLPAVVDWFRDYPFACLEQRTSRSIGGRDSVLWSKTIAEMPAYIDSAGLAAYYPLSESQGSSSNGGSVALTAYLLSISHEASALKPEFALPNELTLRMQNALIAFVQGRLKENAWAPRDDLDQRKISAIEALSRYGRATPAMLQSIQITPNTWPSHTLVQWMGILQNTPTLAKRDELLAQAENVMRSRLTWSGTKVVLSTERSDNWWWVMENADTSTAKLILTVMKRPQWQGDIGRLVSGLMARQVRGTWQTTTANMWGSLALEKFAREFEKVPASGALQVQLGAQTASLQVKGPAQTADQTSNYSVYLPWLTKPGQTGAATASLSAKHTGSGAPWLTVQSLAAIPLTKAFYSGYQVSKTVKVLDGESFFAGKSYKRGDVLRVTIEINASADMTQVVLQDPIPGGATILGTGLGRDSQLGTEGERSEGWAWPAFEERSFAAYRAYFDYLPQGKHKIEYSVRLNSVGTFSLPPTRIEAMYAPDVFGESPNAKVSVKAQ